MTNLRMDVIRADERVVVAFSGELDMAEAPRVQQELEELASSRPGLLVLDLRGVSFIDSSGLRVILESDIRSRRQGWRVAVVPGPEQVHRIFLIALLDKRLDFIDPSELEGGP
jgi:anti-sigma B factor antagonist